MAAASGTASCGLKADTGLSAPKVVLTANQAGNTAAFTYAARANAAAATITTTTANTASVVSFGFTSAGYDIAINDKINLVLPSFSGAASPEWAKQSGCGANTAGDSAFT